MRPILCLALACSACVTKVDSFTCDGHDQCSGGMCEATGFCSVADPVCTSGRRYVSESGSLAGVCVGGEPTDGGGGADGGVDTVPGGCGDGVMNTGEECDDGDDENDDGCVDCRIARCGDGHLRAGAEECDDSNTVDDDGCTSACLTCTGGDGTLAIDGHCYLRSDTGTTWAGAYDNCVAAGGHLASYETRAESEAVAAILTGGNLFWIGLNDQANDGQYFWEFVPLVEAQAHWGSGEPAGNPNDDCVAHLGGAGWDQIGCNDIHGYVCEKDPWLIPSGSTHAYQIRALTRRAGPWQDAHTDCTDRGAHLVSIVDAAEQAFLAPFVKTRSWLGAQDLSTEGTFVWATGEAFSFTMWGPSQPDNGGNADCVAIDTTGEWFDDQCGATAAWICEVE